VHLKMMAEFRHVPEMAEMKHDKLQPSWPVSLRDSNQASPKYKSEALHPEPICSAWYHFQLYVYVTAGFCEYVEVPSDSIEPWSFLASWITLMYCRRSCVCN
jgi:hypothetical protein